MFVSPPDPYLVPDYKISPFRTEDISKNLHLPDQKESDKESDTYFAQRHPGFDIRYTRNGREALHLALAQLGLKKEDVVTILTTTQNRYISSCVTSVVEQFCSWNREPAANTQAVIVIHEFGYVYRDLHTLKRRLSVPIIEDCAYSFFSGDAHGLSGRVGDFVVYSFPKMFPLQEGGLLASRKKLPVDNEGENSRVYYRRVLSAYLSEEDNIKKARRENYDYLIQAMRVRGLNERLSPTPYETPGAFLFACVGVNLDELKKHMLRHGIQCSVFYGEEAFFLPVHQRLNRDDLDYFLYVFDTFIRSTKP